MLWHIFFMPSFLCWIILDQMDFLMWHKTFHYQGHCPWMHYVHVFILVVVGEGEKDLDSTYYACGLSTSFHMCAFSPESIFGCICLRNFALRLFGFPPTCPGGTRRWTFQLQHTDAHTCTSKLAQVNDCTFQVIRLRNITPQRPNSW